MSRSRFANYRRGVVYHLVKNCGWEEVPATEWVSENKDYMYAMYSSACPRIQTAYYIDTMTKKVDALYG